MVVKDPAVDWGAEELDDWNVVATEAGLGQHRLLAERQAVQVDVGVAAVADGDGPVDDRPHLQLVEGDEEAFVNVTVNKSVPSKLLTSTVTANFDRGSQKLKKIVGATWFKIGRLSQNIFCNTRKN